jgi:phosphonate transport system substrate-binding protein
VSAYAPPGRGGRQLAQIPRVPRLFGAAAALVLVALASLACGDQGGARAAAGEKLRVGLVPNIAPDTQRAGYEPFARYLEQATGRRVELFVATNYAGTVAALESGQLDLAYLGGLTYVQARRRTTLVPLVTEIDRDTGTREYLSQIVTRADSGIGRLADLAGKDFAFGDPSSTSGSLYPRAMLVEAGFACSRTALDSCPPLGRVLFAGGHDAAAQALVSGQVAAAGIEARILEGLQRDGKVPRSLHVLAERRVMGYPWVVPASLDAGLRGRLVDAFEGIADPSLLDLLRARGYQAVGPQEYAEIERLGRQLGLVEGG